MRWRSIGGETDPGTWSSVKRSALGVQLAEHLEAPLSASHAREPVVDERDPHGWGRRFTRRLYLAAGPLRQRPRPRAGGRPGQTAVVECEALNRLIVFMPLARHPWIALAAVYAALCAVAGLWLAIDRHPFEWDYASHLERALRCHQILAGAGPPGIRAILEGPESFYPPLVFCAAGLLYGVLPATPVTAQLVILAFLGVGMAAVFALARHLAGPGAGLLAAFLFGTAPFVVYSTLNFQLDLPLAALVALALLALVRADGFRHGGWALAFGAVCGVGLLTKPPFPMYVAAPLVWVSVCAMRPPDRRRRLAWLAAALAVAALIALPWYGPRLLSIPGQVFGRSYDNAAREGQAPALTMESLTYYPRVFLSQFGWLAGLAFAWGLWALRRRADVRMVLWLAALVPVAAFTVIQNKNLRYTLPALGAAAIVAAIGVRDLRPPWRRAAVSALVALGCLQVTMSAFAVPPPPTIPPFPLAIAIPYPPSRDDWGHDRILGDVARASGGQPATVAVVPNHAYFSKSNFAYEVARRGLPVRVVRLSGDVPRGVDFIVLKRATRARRSRERARGASRRPSRPEARGSTACTL